MQLYSFHEIYFLFLGLKSLAWINFVMLSVYHYKCLALLHFFRWRNSQVYYKNIDGGCRYTNNALHPGII